MPLLRRESQILPNFLLKNRYSIPKINSKITVMKNRQFAFLLLLFCLFLQVPSQAQPDALMGFSPTAATTQLNTEKQFDQLLTATNLDEWMKYM